MKKVVVTGANGFLGSHVIRELVNQGVEVIGVVRNRESNVDSLNELENLTIVYCELDKLGQLPEIITARNFDVFYHFAWEGSAGYSRIDEELQLKNALWTVESVRVAKQLGCRRFVGAGSIMEAEALAAIYTQENKAGMSYVYGTAKVTAHSISKMVATQLNIEHLWGKITNAFGPGETSPRFINTTIRKILKNEPLEFTSAVQNYDFVYITDVANAFYHIGLNGKPFCEYIIGSSRAKPLKEFIIELQQTLDPSLEFHFGQVPFTGVNLDLKHFSTENTEMDTGFKAKVPFSIGVKNTMRWIKDLGDF